MNAKTFAVVAVLAVVVLWGTAKGLEQCSSGCSDTHPAESYAFGPGVNWNCRAFTDGFTCLQADYDYMVDVIVTPDCLDVIPAETVKMWKCVCTEKCDGATVADKREMTPPNTVNDRPCRFIQSRDKKECVPS